MIGPRESTFELITAMVFVAVVVVGALTWILGQVTSRIGCGYGCYDCGWRGKRHEMYRKVPGLDGAAFHLVVHFFLVYYMLFHMIARASAELKCPECASPHVLRQDANAPPLPPPRRSMKARDFLRRKKAGEPTAAVQATLVRCVKCHAVVALNPQDLAVACPHCGAAPFIYSKA